MDGSGRGRRRVKEKASKTARNKERNSGSNVPYLEGDRAERELDLECQMWERGGFIS